MLLPSVGRSMRPVIEPAIERAAVYLLEAYATGVASEPAPADALRAEIEARDGLRIIGFVVVPADEAILCLLSADGPGSAGVVREIADRYGAGARLLEVSWAPG
jgi:hypothetical protein